MSMVLNHGSKKVEDVNKDNTSLNTIDNILDDLEYYMFTKEMIVRLEKKPEKPEKKSKKSDSE